MQKYIQSKHKTDLCSSELKAHCQWSHQIETSAPASSDRGRGQQYSPSRKVTCLSTKTTGHIRVPWPHLIEASDNARMVQRCQQTTTRATCAQKNKAMPWPHQIEAESKARKEQRSKQASTTRRMQVRKIEAPHQWRQAKNQLVSTSLEVMCPGLIR